MPTSRPTVIYPCTRFLLPFPCFETVEQVGWRICENSFCAARYFMALIGRFQAGATVLKAGYSGASLPFPNRARLPVSRSHDDAHDPGPAGTAIHLLQQLTPERVNRCRRATSFVGASGPFITESANCC